MSSIISEAANVPQTFSSWDSCMSKAYCKYPAIVGIAVGGLILLSVLFCLFQCLCCGYSCAKMLCCCCNGCDCGGKDRRRGRDDRPTKHKDDYHQLHQPNPYSGYQPPAAMATGWRNVPQTATFESSKGGDSLPAMPSWDNAVSHRVEITEPAPPAKKPEDLEMGRLNTRHNGYDQVPLSPTSPTHAIPGYFPPSQTSPNHQQYPYQSDLSQQRLSPQPTGYSSYHNLRNSNSDFPSHATTPSSPAPTYQTYAQQPHNNNYQNTDRFMSGTASPSPYGYIPHQRTPSYPASSTQYEPSYTTTNNDSYIARQQTFSPPPAGTMPTSTSSPTLYDNSSASPYGGYGNNYSTPAYEQQATSPRGDNNRPPSLLQVGRKAVPGSRREV